MTTAALEPLRGTRSRAPHYVIVAAALGEPGTSTTPPTDFEVYVETSTSAGTPFIVGVRRPAPTGLTTAAALMALRRRTGLGWDQLARLFQVSRRTLHNWANGAVLARGNEERLHRVLGAIERFDRGSAAATRAALFSPVGAAVPFDLLKDGHFDTFNALTPAGEGRPRSTRPSPATAPRADQTPPAPATLLAALPDVKPKRQPRLIASSPLRRPPSR